MAEDKKEIRKELFGLYEEMEKLRKRKLELTSKLAEKELDRDYGFIARDGSKKNLSEMFGDKKYLYTIHNMGIGCSYCTMWADGFNDTFKYLQKKGAFVLINPDNQEIQNKMASERGWKFDMYQDDSAEFSTDMGYCDVNRNFHPGVSVFEKSDDGKIRRVNTDSFGPTDYYCNVWHFYDLLPSENITVNS